MSPLLFVMVMEYVSRLLKQLGQLSDFRYHRMCKDQQIISPLQMIFCKENKAFVRRIMEALTYFFNMTGLEANSDKSSIFIAGVKKKVVQNLLRPTGFQVDCFAIKYLRLPLSPKKWSK